MIDAPELTTLTLSWFSRTRALDSGLTDRDLARGVADRTLIRVRHGYYILAKHWHALDAAGQHLVRARCALDAQRGRVALAGVSAAVAHGFLVHDQDLSMVHLIRLDGSVGRTEAGTVHHVGPYTDTDFVDLDGVLATSAALTVCDVARTSGLEAGVVTADSALRRDPALKPELAAMLDRTGHLAGIKQARVTLGRADGRAANGGESYCRMQFYRYHVPIPELQVEIFSTDGESLGTVDFDWQEYRHLGEFDGREKYERYVRTGETPGDVVFREKRREDRLRGTLRGMSRFWWAIVQPSRVASTMRELHHSLQESRRRYWPRP